MVLHAVLAETTTNKQTTANIITLWCRKSVGQCWPAQWTTKLIEERVLLLDAEPRLVLLDALECVDNAVAARVVVAV
jgi:hypothetical protein